ncbi:uncharacterized protein LOC134456392 [Engraulis encrasicolus]|uniref:uncharacterized protein LOC134456392 n=1 Tax=Engraulis encrasicolus TaxID=184585 RepID=UPI002FD019AA
MIGSSDILALAGGGGERVADYRAQRICSGSSSSESMCHCAFGDGVDTRLLFTSPPTPKPRLQEALRLLIGGYRATWPSGHTTCYQDFLVEEEEEEDSWALLGDETLGLCVYARYVSLTLAEGVRSVAMAMVSHDPRKMLQELPQTLELLCAIQRGFHGDPSLLAHQQETSRLLPPLWSTHFLFESRHSLFETGDFTGSSSAGKVLLGNQVTPSYAPCKTLPPASLHDSSPYKTPSPTSIHDTRHSLFETGNFTGSSSAGKVLLGNQVTPSYSPCKTLPPASLHDSSPYKTPSPTSLHGTRHSLFETGDFTGSSSAGKVLLGNQVTPSYAPCKTLPHASLHDSSPYKTPYPTSLHDTCNSCTEFGDIGSSTPGKVLRGNPVTPSNALCKTPSPGSLCDSSPFKTPSPTSLHGTCHAGVYGTVHSNSPLSVISTHDNTPCITPQPTCLSDKAPCDSPQLSGAYGNTPSSLNSVRSSSPLPPSHHGNTSCNTTAVPNNSHGNTSCDTSHPKNLQGLPTDLYGNTPSLASHRGNTPLLTNSHGNPSCDTSHHDNLQGLHTDLYGYNTPPLSDLYGVTPPLTSPYDNVPCNTPHPASIHSGCDLTASCVEAVTIRLQVEDIISPLQQPFFSPPGTMTTDLEEDMSMETSSQSSSDDSIEVLLDEQSSVAMESTVGMYGHSIEKSAVDEDKHSFDIETAADIDSDGIETAASVDSKDAMETTVCILLDTKDSVTTEIGWRSFVARDISVEMGDWKTGVVQDCVTIEADDGTSIIGDVSTDTGWRTAVEGGCLAIDTDDGIEGVTEDTGWRTGAEGHVLAMDSGEGRDVMESVVSRSATVRTDSQDSIEVLSRDCLLSEDSLLQRLMGSVVQQQQEEGKDFWPEDFTSTYSLLQGLMGSVGELEGLGHVDTTIVQEKEDLQDAFSPCIQEECMDNVAQERTHREQVMSSSIVQDRTEGCMDIVVQEREQARVAVGNEVHETAEVQARTEVVLGSVAQETSEEVMGTVVQDKTKGVQGVVDVINQGRTEAQGFVGIEVQQMAEAQEGMGIVVQEIDEAQVVMGNEVHETADRGEDPDMVFQEGAGDKEVMGTLVLERGASDGVLRRVGPSTCPLKVLDLYLFDMFWGACPVSKPLHLCPRARKDNPAPSSNTSPRVDVSWRQARGNAALRLVRGWPHVRHVVFSLLIGRPLVVIGGTREKVQELVHALEFFLPNTHTDTHQHSNTHADTDTPAHTHRVLPWCCRPIHINDLLEYRIIGLNRTVSVKQYHRYLTVVDADHMTFLGPAYRGTLIGQLTDQSHIKEGGTYALLVQSAFTRLAARAFHQVFSNPEKEKPPQRDAADDIRILNFLCDVIKLRLTNRDPSSVLRFKYEPYTYFK